MTELERIIAREIHRQGPIAFVRFMELALYCPNFGYYRRPQPGIGRAGDFYTSVSVGSLFGQLLVCQFLSWMDQQSLGRGQWLETGAHDGRLAADMLAWLRRQQPARLEQLEYWIVEPSPRLRELQQSRLRDFADRVRWFDSFEVLPAEGVRGIIFSNELLDAFPVHRLGWDAARRCWFEWGVALSPAECGARNAEFVWARLPADHPRWTTELEAAGLELPPELLAVLPDGFTVEVCPEAAAWWARAAGALRAGKLLTLDYGLTADERLRPERCQGTVRAYGRHRLSDDPLARPGEQDLTAHINFTQLQRAGERAGLQSDPLVSQAQFLTAIAGRAWREPAALGGWSPACARQFHTLTRPEYLGRAFRVLVQTSTGK